MPTISLPTERLKRAIATAAGATHSHFVDATRLATALLGNSIGANMFMLGYAYQLGALPLSAEAIEQAIELNGEAVAMNVAAFRWGRRAAADPAAVEALVKPQPEAERRIAQAVAVVRRDGRAPRRFPHRVSERGLCGALQELGRESESRPKPKLTPGKSALAEAVARYLFKLMAYKDEYEVARLYTDGTFVKQVTVDLRRRPASCNSISRRRCSRARTRSPASRAKIIIRAVDDVGVSACSRKFRFLRGTPLDSSATATSAAPSAS